MKLLFTIFLLFLFNQFCFGDTWEGSYHIRYAEQAEQFNEQYYE